MTPEIQTYIESNDEAHASASAYREGEPTLERYSHVGKLPVELLTRIFSLYTASASSSSLCYLYHLLYEEEKYLDIHKINIVTAVCRRWREVAQASPRLWCRLKIQESSSPSYVRQLLSLSQTQPLYIILKRGHGWRRSFGVFEAIISNLSRIRSLELGWCTEEHLQRIAPTRASLLKKLALELALPSGRTIAELEACDIPYLEHLTIQGYALRWDSKLLRPTLTQLSLNQPKGLPGHSLSNVLDVLATLPLLQYLELKNALPITPQGVPPAQTVHFPRLRDIWLEADSAVTAQFLRHTIFPTSVSMVLVCEDEDMNGLQSVLAAIVDKWTGRCATGPPASFGSASFYSSSATDRDEYALSCDRTPDNSGDRADFELSFRSEGWIEPEIVAAIMRALSVLKLTYLYLAAEACGPYDADTWFAYCASMIHLQTLHVDEEWAGDALYLALERHLPATGALAQHSLSSHRPLFPQLRKLHLVSTRYHNPEADPPDPDDEDRKCTIPVKEYLKAVIARASSGTLEEVIVTAEYADKSPEGIADLAQYVKVTWEGGEEDESGESETDEASEEGDQDETEDDEDEDEDKDDDGSSEDDGDENIAEDRT